MADGRPLRLHAYTLLADPAWLPLSIGSYYDLVDKIVVSHDHLGRGWNGWDLSAPTAAGRALVEALDVDGKVEWLTEDFVAADGDNAAAENRQRQRSLDVASVGADWVLQLDTDEVLPDPAYVAAAIARADAAGVDGLELSARFLHTHIRGRWFTEQSTRRLRFWDGIPGPIAVRAGTRIHYIRQIEGVCRRLAVHLPADERLPLDKAILHFSMVRQRSDVLAKSKLSGHADDFDWSPRLREWDLLDRRPVWGLVSSVVRPVERGRAFRPVRLPAGYDDEVVARQTSHGSLGDGRSHALGGDR